MKKYYTKKVPKCRSLTLEQIYGVQNNIKTEKKRQAIGCDDKEFLKSLKEVGRFPKRQENHRDRG